MQYVYYCATAFRLSAPDILVEVTSWYILQDNPQVCGRQNNPFEHHDMGVAEAAVSQNLAADVSGDMLLASWQELDSNLFTCLPASHQVRDGAVSDQALSGSCMVNNPMVVPHLFLASCTKPKVPLPRSLIFSYLACPARGSSSFSMTSRSLCSPRFILFG